MEYRQLGRTDIRVPELGLGTHRYTGGVGPLRRGIELGASMVDTAESYGTEHIVGKALAGMRRQVIIATKFSPVHNRYRDVLEAADSSLRLLDTDYIDLYQLHHFTPAIPLAETLGAMEDLVDSGKVRFIGVCNFSVKQLKLSQAALGKHPVVSNQIDFSLITRDVEEGLFPYCREFGITIIAHSPLGRGLPNIRFRDRGNALSNVAAETGGSEAQVALNWCISHENVIAIPKGNSGDHVEDNCNASGWRLSPEQFALLEERIKPFRRRGDSEAALRKAARRILVRLHLR